MRDREPRRTRRRPIDQRGAQPSGVPAAERGPRPSRIQDSSTVYFKTGSRDDRNPNLGPNNCLYEDAIVLANGQPVSVMSKESAARAAALRGQPRVAELPGEPDVGSSAGQSIAKAESGRPTGYTINNKAKTK